MMHRYRSLLSVVYVSLLSVIGSGCSSDDSVNETPVTVAKMTKATDIPGDAAKTGATTYYRFSDSSIVTGADTATANWDIAFRSTTILINGGTSGPGQGGAQIVTGDFSTVKVAPDAGYNVDATGAPAITTGSDNGWYHYDPNTNIISALPGKVIVVRCGNGKYAKVQIVSYYKGAPATPDVNSVSRYYTFNFLYQADGSKKLE